MAIWNTQIIDIVKDEKIPLALLSESPFFKGTKARKASLDFHYSVEEMEERAAARHIPPDAVQLRKWFGFEPRHFQEEIMSGLLNKRFNIVHLGRQMGASTMFRIISIVNAVMGKKVLVISPNGRMCEDFIDHTKELLVKMPFYIQPGVETWNVRSLTFEDSEIICKDAKSLMKMPDLEKWVQRFDLVLLDGADFMDDYHILHKRIFTACSDGKTSSMSVSTLAGDKYGVLRDAAQGESSFLYWRVPATQAFSIEEIGEFKSMFGSEEAFTKEFSAEFAKPVYTRTPDEMMSSSSTIRVIMEDKMKCGTIIGELDEIQGLVQTHMRTQNPGSPMPIIVRMLDVLRQMADNK